MQNWIDAAVPAALSLGLALGIRSAVRYHNERYDRGTIRSAGRRRRYLLHVPAGYDPATPVPLVIALHSYGQWPFQHNAVSHWNDLADEHGFIVVYPYGMSFPLYWRIGGPGGRLSNPAPDIAFISDLIDRLQAEYAIDPRRIYANGHSNGGGLSYVLACALPERIAAVGMISGAYLYRGCNSDTPRPVPAVVFHGTGDAIVPYNGGVAGFWRVRFPSVPEWVESLARHNGCALPPAPLPAQGDVRGLHYRGPEAEVLFYTIEGGGHTWPGADGPQSRRTGYCTVFIDATREMWAFFARHRLPESAAPAGA